MYPEDKELPLIYLFIYLFILSPTLTFITLTFLAETSKINHGIYIDKFHFDSLANLEKINIDQKIKIKKHLFLITYNIFN